MSLSLKKSDVNILRWYIINLEMVLVTPYSPNTELDTIKRWLFRENNPHNVHQKLWILNNPLKQMSVMATGMVPRK